MSKNKRFIICISVVLIFVMIFIGVKIYKKTSKIKKISESTDFSKFVLLPDYDNLVIDYSKIEMSEEDLNDAIIIDLQMNNIPLKMDGQTVLPYIDDQTSLKYFNINAEQYKTELKKRVERVRIWDYICEYIFDNSKIEYIPKISLDNYSYYVTSNLKEQAKSENITVDEYVVDAFGMNFQEFCDQIDEQYTGMLIIYAVAQKEKLHYDKHQLEEKKKEMLDTGYIYSEDINLFGDEYVLYLAYMSDLEEILVEKINVF